MLDLTIIILFHLGLLFQLILFLDHIFILVGDSLFEGQHIPHGNFHFTWLDQIRVSLLHVGLEAIRIDVD
jgi:hypothetical protein